MKKLREFPTFNEELDIRYGKKGTPSRVAFDKEADEYYRKNYRTQSNEKAVKKKEAFAVKSQR